MATMPATPSSGPLNAQKRFFGRRPANLARKEPKNSGQASFQEATEKVSSTVFSEK